MLRLPTKDKEPWAFLQNAQHWLDRVWRLLLWDLLNAQLCSRIETLRPLFVGGKKKVNKKIPVELLVSDILICGLNGVIRSMFCWGQTRKHWCLRYICLQNWAILVLFFPRLALCFVSSDYFLDASCLPGAPSPKQIQAKQLEAHHFWINKCSCAVYYRCRWGDRSLNLAG